HPRAALRARVPGRARGGAPRRDESLREVLAAGRAHLSRLPPRQGLAQRAWQRPAPVWRGGRGGVGTAPFLRYSAPASPVRETMLRPGTFALTAALAALTGIGPLTTDMYLPSLPSIANELHAPIA